MIERSFFFYSFYAIITFDKSWWKLGDRVAKVNDLKQENKSLEDVFIEKLHGSKGQLRW